MTKYYIKYLSLFIGLGAYTTFLPVYLENSLNFSPIELGIILSIPSILGIIFVPIWGIVSDISNKKKTVLFFNIFMSLSLILVFLYTKSFLRVFVVCSILEIFRNAILPLLDSLATFYCNLNNKNYGSIRVMGSFSFAASSFLCGYIIKMISNNNAFLYIFIFSMVCCLIVTPFLDVDYSKGNSEKMNLKYDLPLLFNNKKFIIILLCGISLSSLTESVMSYQGIHLINLGGSTQMVGLLVVFMVFPELIFMVKTKQLLEKYGIVKMLNIASLLCLVRWTIYYFTSSPIVFMITSCLHGVTVSILMICAFDFITKVVEPKLHTTAMTVYTFTIGVSYSILKLLYGHMIESFGIRSIFLLCIIVSTSSFFVFKALKDSLNDDIITNTIKAP